MQVQQKQVWDDAVIQRLIEIDPLISDDMGFLGKRRILVVSKTYKGAVQFRKTQHNATQQYISYIYIINIRYI